MEVSPLGGQGDGLPTRANSPGVDRLPPHHQYDATPGRVRVPRTPWVPGSPNRVSPGSSRARYRYSRSQDRGILWSSDPGRPIGQMARTLGLLETAAQARETRPLRTQDWLRGVPARSRGCGSLAAANHRGRFPA